MFCLEEGGLSLSLSLVKEFRQKIQGRQMVVNHTVVSLKDREREILAQNHSWQLNPIEILLILIQTDETVQLSKFRLP